MSPLLSGVRVVEVGGRAGSVCGQLFAEMGADVLTLHIPGAPFGSDDAGESIIFRANKRHVDADLATENGKMLFARYAGAADVVIIDLPTRDLDALGLNEERLTALNPRLVTAIITPFGTTGPRRDYVGSDLVTFHSSGIARLLFGRVEDPEVEPPVRAAAEQSDFIVGLTAATAVMNGVYQQQATGEGQYIDISSQEAMSLMAARELALPAFGGKAESRRGGNPGGTATGPRLPTSDGYVALSPREPGQWAQWLHVLGDPEWGTDPKFADRQTRVKNFNELYDLMAEWSRTRGREEITEICQAAHVPCYPFGTPADMFNEPQLGHRGFFTALERPGQQPVLVPRPPFGLPAGDYATLRFAAGGDFDWSPRPTEHMTGRTGRLPLEGVRVLDFSWVVAGPTGTRYMSLMGAEVIKIENPGRPDSARNGGLHDVVGQSKLGMSIDLKADGALAAVRRLLKDTDIVVDNFATGVMDRLGLGSDDLRAIRPDIIQLSSSGLGRHGPRAEWVAYGSLLSAYVGFLEEPPERAPKTGMAWVDPLSGLYLGFIAVAALRERARTGAGRHVDFSMLEGLLWTMPNALLAAQVPDTAAMNSGNEDPRFAPHGVYRAEGDDRWVAVAVTDDDQWRALCGVVPTLGSLSALSESERRLQATTIDEHLRAWIIDRNDVEAMDALQHAGVPASASYNTDDLYVDPHLDARGFYKTIIEDDGTQRRLPGLPWRWGDDTAIEHRAAPGQGQHTQSVLQRVGGLSSLEVQAMEAAGAFGKLHA